MGVRSGLSLESLSMIRSRGIDEMTALALPGLAEGADWKHPFRATVVADIPPVITTRRVSLGKSPLSPLSPERDTIAFLSIYFEGTLFENFCRERSLRHCGNVELQVDFRECARVELYSEYSEEFQSIWHSLAFMNFEAWFQRSALILLYLQTPMYKFFLGSRVTKVILWKWIWFFESVIWKLCKM